VYLLSALNFEKSQRSQSPIIMFGPAKKRVQSKAPSQASKWQTELEKLAKEQEQFRQYSDQFPGINKILQRAIADLKADLAKVQSNSGGAKSPKRQEKALKRALSYRKRVPVYHALVAESELPQNNSMHKSGVILSFLARLKGKRNAKKYQVCEGNQEPTPVAEPAVVVEPGRTAVQATKEKERDAGQKKQQQTLHPLSPMGQKKQQQQTLQPLSPKDAAALAENAQQLCKDTVAATSSLQQGVSTLSAAENQLKNDIANLEKMNQEGAGKVDKLVKEYAEAKDQPEFVYPKEELGISTAPSAGFADLGHAEREQLVANRKREKIARLRQEQEDREMAESKGRFGNR
jgi:hypothetical protein